MVFSSVIFLFYFLPIFLLAYLLLPWRNTVLFIGSLLFYAWGEPLYVLLFLFSLTFNYVGGLCIAARGRRHARLALTTTVICNLLFIGVFKYAAFLVGNLNALLALCHITALPVPELRLPLGISFWTFQAISYLLDVYRGDTPPERRPLNVALYISMFPQLIAGPIVRFKTISEEIHSRQLSSALFAAGVRAFAVGLGQKVLLANTLAIVADGIFDTPVASVGCLGAWLGALSYTGQIYFDFAGYSNMAIGLGFMMGFHLPKNFNYPYTSRSVTEFWQRWHMTLSTWFRDYLYIPLGGNRRGPVRTYLNLLIVFLLCGLWHGASWTFIVWGGYHGAFLVVERIGFKRLLALRFGPLARAYTLVVVIVGWVIFRAETFGHAAALLKRMLLTLPTRSDAIATLEYLNPHYLIIAVVSVLASTPLIPALHHRVAAGRWGAPRWALLGSVGAFALLILVAMSLASGTYNPFIYFRF